MKRSELAPVYLSKEGIEEFMIEMRNFVSSNVFSERFTKPGYGITPVKDAATQVVVGYDTLGDPNDAKAETLEFNIFGNKIELPVLVSKYKLPTTGGDKEEVVKTLNFSKDKTEEVLKSLIAIHKLALFANDWLEIPLRGLMAEVQNIPAPTDGTLPHFGKEFLDIWTATLPSANATAELSKRYKVISDVQHLKNGVYKANLTYKIGIYETMLDLITKRIDNNVPLSSIVGRFNYNPEVVAPQYNVIAATNIEGVNNNFTSRLNGMPVANSVMPKATK